MRRTWALRAFAIAGVITLVSLALTEVADAHPAACVYDGASTVAVTLTSETAIVSRQTDAIALNGTPCQDGGNTTTATVNNTTSISVTGTGSGDQLTIDLSGGPFTPSGGPDIQWTVDLGSGGLLTIEGSSDPDFVTFGGNKINLNANEGTEDADVTVTGQPTLEADGVGGNDTLSAAGGQGTADPIGGVTLHGDDGDDTLIVGSGGGGLDGGAGSDTIDFGGSQQVDVSLATGTATVNTSTETTFTNIENVTGSPGDDTITGDANDNVLRGASGTDTLDYSNAAQGVVVDLGGGVATGDGTDQIAQFENVIGSAFDDELHGGNGSNVISAGAGDDLVIGGGGDDQLDGGAGTDTLDFSGSSKGVQVDLGRGSATGQGTDDLAGFENVSGSSHNDTVKGDAGPNAIEGGAGHDDLEGRKGSDFLSGGKNADLLFGGMGQDHLKGGPGKDQLDGGQGTDTCSGGPDPDAWTLCEAGPSH